MSVRSFGSGYPPVSGKKDVSTTEIKAALPNIIGGSWSSTLASADMVVAHTPPMRASIEPAPTPAFLQNNKSYANPQS